MLSRIIDRILDKIIDKIVDKIVQYRTVVARESHRQRHESRLYSGHRRPPYQNEGEKWVVANYLRKAGYILPSTSYLLLSM